jgi:hypothetical protein
MELVESVKGMPADAAARASSRSPWRRNKPSSPTGAAIAGRADGIPRIGAPTLRRETPTSARGRNRAAIRLQRDLILGATVEKIEHETRNALSRHPAQILDVDRLAESHRRAARALMIDRMTKG